jgi:hypothetical protein
MLQKYAGCLFMLRKYAKTHSCKLCIYMQIAEPVLKVYKLFVTLNKVLYVIRIKCCLSSGLVCDRTMSTYIEINSLATDLMYSELLQAL